MTKILTLAGLEPAIPWFVVRCLIRWATGPLAVYSFKYHNLNWNVSVPVAMWLVGLGVWFSLRVREVPGSNPGRAQVKPFLRIFRKLLVTFVTCCQILWRTKTKNNSVSITCYYHNLLIAFYNEIFKKYSIANRLCILRHFSWLECHYVINHNQTSYNGHDNMFFAF